jgi:hypothetical protein
MIRLYTFLVFVAISTMILYIAFVMQKSSFVGNTELLIIPESTIIAENADNTVNNIVAISQDAISLNAVTENYNADVKIDRLKGTDIIEFKTFANSESDVIFVEKSALKSSLIAIEKYYNIGTDFSIKIIGIQSVNETNISAWIMYVLFGIVATGLMSGAILIFGSINETKEKDEKIDGEKIFKKYNNKKENDFSDKDILALVDAEIEIQEDDADLKEAVVDDILDENEVIDAIDEEKKNLKQKADNFKSFEDVSVPEGLPTTPGNLPVVDISDFGGNTESEKNNKNDNQIPQEDIEAGKTEPTEEELKARLNELLNGKL